MKNLFLLLLFIGVTVSAQPYEGQLVTNAGDTLKVEILNTALVRNMLIVVLQQKIAVKQNGVYSEYTAKDLKSYRIKIKSKEYIYDSMDGMFFAERFYVGKVKLYKYLKENPQLVRIYMFKKPNEDKWWHMPAMGFSRLLTKNALESVFSDCKVAYDKIESDEIKIKDEEKLIEFVRFYEANCGY